MRFGSIWLKILISAVVAVLFAAHADGAFSAVNATGATARFNMSYIYFGNSGVYTDCVDNTGGSINDISPSYFDLDANGSLKLTMAVDRGFINNMRARGIKVTPFLSNHWDRQKGINALNNREALASQVAAAVSEYGLDGVNVDIENVTENERDIYTDFVKLLRQKLPAEKSVSVAVAPNPYNLTTGWHGSYDYAGLSKYSDYLMLMAYDDHWQGSEAGPVAGIEFVESSVQAALKHVPSNKLVLGIPFYGRLWKRGASYGGYGVSNNKVEELIGKYNGKVVYDGVQESPKAVITIRTADIKPTVFGMTLDAGTYDIWFENEASIKQKIKLVGKYNLKGTGSWSLGQETNDTWDYYSLWLSGRYFTDIQSHWAKASIVQALDYGWMNGMASDRFMPDESVTRAQAAALIVRALSIDTSAAGRQRPLFSDTTGHWAFAEIEAAAMNGLVEGVGGGKFEPDKVLTREQMAVLLDRIIKVDEPSSSLFYDVTAGTSQWSYEAICKMAAAGLLKGFPDGTFRPKAIISRGQIAVLMERSYPLMTGGALAG